MSSIRNKSKLIKKTVTVAVRRINKIPSSTDEINYQSNDKYTHKVTSVEKSVYFWKINFEKQLAKQDPVSQFLVTRGLTGHSSPTLDSAILFPHEKLLLTTGDCYNAFMKMDIDEESTEINIPPEQQAIPDQDLGNWLNQQLVNSFINPENLGLYGSLVSKTLCDVYKYSPNCDAINSLHTNTIQFIQLTQQQCKEGKQIKESRWNEEQCKNPDTICFDGCLLPDLKIETTDICILHGNTCGLCAVKRVGSSNNGSLCYVVGQTIVSGRVFLDKKPEYLTFISNKCGKEITDVSTFYIVLLDEKHANKSLFDRLTTFQRHLFMSLLETFKEMKLNLKVQIIDFRK